MSMKLDFTKEGECKITNTYKPMTLSEVKRLVYNKEYKTIIENNIGLAYSIAIQTWNSNYKGKIRNNSKMSSVPVGVTLDDLLQESILGLMYAVTRYNPELGYQFSTYATFWVKKSLRDFINKNSSLLSMSNSMVQDLKKHIYQKTNELNKDTFNCRSKNIDAIALHYENTLRDVGGGRSEIKYDRHVSQVEINDNNENNVILSHHMQKSTKGHDHIQEIMSRNKKLRELMKTKLTEREYFVLSEYYGFAEDEPILDCYDKIGEILGVSKEYVRLIHNSGIEKMKRALKNYHDWI